MLQLFDVLVDFIQFLLQQLEPFVKFIQMLLIKIKERNQAILFMLEDVSSSLVVFGLLLVQRDSEPFLGGVSSVLNVSELKTLTCLLKFLVVEITADGIAALIF